MTMKRALLFAIVLLGVTATLPGVAIAGDCSLIRCAAGVNEVGRCKANAYISCDEACYDNGCDGGYSVGGEFYCGGFAFKTCQCNSCDLYELSQIFQPNIEKASESPLRPRPGQWCSVVE